MTFLSGDGKMNYLLILLILGRILLLSAVSMLPPLLVSLIYGDGAHFSFIISAAALLVTGGVLVLLFLKHERSMRPREGFVTVALCWIAISLFGALPPFISGAIPNYIDALFEMTSGFTTTGATILQSIETLPESIVFWRGLTQWVGGMGVLLLTLAILPSDDRGIYNLMRAEATGPASERIVPRIRKTAAILYTIYLTLTLLMTVMLLSGGMNLFDALLHAFTTASTGGFSSRDLSVGAYQSAYIEYTVAAFLLLFSINYTLYFAVVTRRFAKIRKNTELKVFFGLIAVSTVLVSMDLIRSGVFDTIEETIRHSFFQVSSSGSSTAFFTTDYSMWPDFSRLILLCLTVVGGCAGSTAGGIKVIRAVMLGKSAFREIKKILHPRSVIAVHMNGQPVQDKTLTGVLHYFVIYVMIVAAGTLIIALIDQLGVDTSVTCVLSMISNTGPGFGVVGPSSNYSVFSVPSKLLLTLIMLVGRLEIFPILMLLIPSSWRKV